MKKHTFFVILLPLTIMFVSNAYAINEQYHGGPDNGHGMAECTGRLDRVNSKSQGQKTEETRQYHGGPDNGRGMAEYVGPIDNSKGPKAKK